MARSHGYRKKTRSLLTISGSRSPGVSRFLRNYQVNDKVVVLLDPRQVKGMPHRRFHGKVGIVSEVGRRSLVVEVPIGDKVKTVKTRLEHVKPL